MGSAVPLSSRSFELKAYVELAVKVQRDEPSCGESLRQEVPGRWRKCCFLGKEALGSARAKKQCSVVAEGHCRAGEAKQLPGRVQSLGFPISAQFGGYIPFVQAHTEPEQQVWTAQSGLY